MSFYRIIPVKGHVTVLEFGMPQFMIYVQAIHMNLRTDVCHLEPAAENSGIK